MPIVDKNRLPFRIADLLQPGMPEKWVEVIEGELVEMTPAGHPHNAIAYRFQRLFDLFCQSRPEYDFGFDNDGFLLKRDPVVLLCPDASLFRRRAPDSGPWMEFAPEIAVEVLSPRNSPSEMAYKRRKYFEAGTEQVWMVNPEKQSIDFYFRDGRRIIVQGKEVVKGEGSAEGMDINLEMIFGPRWIG